MRCPVRHTLACLSLAILAALASNPASAAFRYVSATGNDNSACATIANPCLTLQRALNGAPLGADIRILSDTLSGNALITKSVTITGNGASIDGYIEIDRPNAEVTLRGLKLNGAQAGEVSGIVIRDARSVSIDNLEISSFQQHGISVDFSDVELSITDTVSQRNGDDGLQFAGTTSAARLVIDRSSFHDNGLMGIVFMTGSATITNSNTSGNTGSGVNIDGYLGETAAHISGHTASLNPANHGFGVFEGATLSLEDSVASGNVFGLFVEPPATAYISGNTFFDNQLFGVVGATIFTRENNSIWGNDTDIEGELTPWPSGGD